MPCRTYDSDEQEHQVTRTRILNDADRATRAACEMRTLIRNRTNLENELSAETRQWISEHDAADALRLRRENEAAVQAAKKQDALNKLTVEERRMFGLPII